MLRNAKPQKHQPTFPPHRNLVFCWYNQKLLSRARTEPPVLLRNSTSRQSSGCVEAELTAPLTALSSPTSVTTSSPPLRAELSLTRTAQRSHWATAEVEGKAGCLLGGRCLGEEQRTYERKNAHGGLCSSCWMLVNLIAWATMHYCQANRETVSRAGERHDRLMAGKKKKEEEALIPILTQLKPPALRNVSEYIVNCNLQTFTSLLTFECSYHISLCQISARQIAYSICKVLFLPAEGG